jgi:hypothetical protein
VGTTTDTDQAIRWEWARVWARAHGLDEDDRPTDDVCIDLSEAYAALDLGAQRVVDPVVAGWLDSDRQHRYEALFLIAEHRIFWALPALRSLAERLASAPDPEDRADLEAVARTIEVLLPSR